MGMHVFAQQAPTITAPGASLNGTTSNQFWSRAGNTNGLGLNNIFGTLWNSPIYTVTDAAYRMKLNGTFTAPGGTNPQYGINGYPFGNSNTSTNTSGYLLLGSDVSSIYTNMGAFSQLHLNGLNSGVIQVFGYRPWMKTGVTLTDNSDLSYMGIRQVGSGSDITETTIVWSDNAGSSSGPDEFALRYTQGGGSTYNPNMADPDDMDGRHIARFTGEGAMGLGNTFGINVTASIAANYARPKSLLHQSFQFDGANAFEGNGFHQITYRRAFGSPSELIGQGEESTDGLRLGIDNQVFSTGGQDYLNSYLRWQERSSFIIQTEDGDDSNIENSERIRITSMGALVDNYGANYLGALGSLRNRTRIGISANGASPVTKPMSLLHLGFDSPVSSGWRDWMDIGTYTTNGNDNMYIGLKRASDDPQNDRFDAIVNWGDNISANPSSANGPDNLRFVFTSNASGSGPAVSNDGLEGMRMTPTTVGVFTGVGGTPTTNPYGPLNSSENATATLEINAWGTATAVNGGNSGLRFTNLNTTSLPVANPGAGYLSVDADGDVIYTYGSAIPGAACGSPANTGNLTANTRLNLSNNNYYFNNETTLANPTYNRVAVGYNCTPALPAKFNVLQKELSSIAFNSIGSHTQTLDIGTQQGQYFIGDRGLSNGVQTIGRITNNGGYFTGANSEINYGVRGEAYRGSYTASPSLSYGGYFTSNDSYSSYGVRASSINPTTGGIAYGIYASADGGNITRAGFFEGLIQTTASYIQTSDSMFKINVNKLSGSLKSLLTLNPVSYSMDSANYPQMNFDDHLQFGYIAQDVEDVFPNLVYESYRPSDLDSLGNPVDSAVTYKSLNYNGFIAVNTQAIIELNKKVDGITLSDQTVKTNIQDLTGSLDKVLDMRGVSYDWNHTVHPELNLDSVNHVGFIAQEIAQIDSRLTYLADDSLLHVEYDKVVPILAEAIQDLNDSIGVRDSIITVLITENSAQQATIDDLNNRLTQLENCLSGILPYLCQLSNSAIQANTPAAQEEVRKNLNVTLSNRNTIVLDQNVPNPFAEQTIINFSIPETVKKAQIHFYDGNGRFMNSVEVTERGLGSVTVFGSDLSTGVYTYTLVADGQVVATKKMMKQ